MKIKDITGYKNVRIETNCFKTNEGMSEYHVMFHITGTNKSFEQQLEDIQSAYEYLLSKYNGKIVPVFKRYFISDAANQFHLLKKYETINSPCAVSIVQQPPLDRSKIALWIYFMSDVKIIPTSTGIIAEHNGYKHIWTGGQGVGGSDSYRQTEILLDKYISDLKEEECCIENDCFRTWFFVQNVDVNYKGLVEARKMFFSNHDLNEQPHYITSTGIEGRYAQSDIHVLFDAYAVKGLKKGQQKFLQASTHLNPTYQYGVTFERGVKVLYGDRDHILISGTASINKEGDIVDPGNITGQTERMLENIKALLLEADASFEDLVQMIVYLRDISDYQIVNSIFEERFPDVPKIITLAPVCRPGWLIETECIAVKESNNPVLRVL